MPNNGGTRKRVLHVMRMKGAAGSENHLRVLVPKLEACGWSSDVLIPTPSPEAVRELAADYRTMCERVTVVPMRTDFSAPLLVRLARLLRSGRYELAHAHLVHADWHLSIASLAAKVPLVSSKHNDDPFRKRTSARLIEQATAKRYGGVIAISDSVNEYTDRWTKPGCPLVTIHYGLDVSANGHSSNGSGPPRAQAPTILTVARLIEQKGLDVLIRAMVRVRRAVPDARLLIAGEGPERKALEAEIRANDLQGAVELLGYRADAPELMRSAWVMAHPSRWEGFGLVFLEAMRVGLPVVATNVSAIPEVVADGVTGTLVPPEDEGALADAIVELLTDEARRRQMSTAARARLESDFSAERMAEQTAGLYERVLAAAG